MSIFNTGSPLMAGSGGKVATWTGSGSGSTVSSISFTVDAEPTSWLLVYAGRPEGISFTSSSTSTYIIQGATYNGSKITGTTARAGSSSAGARIYPLHPLFPYLAQSYSNGTLTLTGSSSRVFSNGEWHNGDYDTYYLLYNTN